MTDRPDDKVGQLLDAISEASQPVSDLGSPSTAETPADLHERLLVTRAAMTRVSELLGRLTLYGGRVRGMVIEHRGYLEDEEAVVVTTRNKINFTEDYSSAKEKNARIGAATLETRVRLRRLEERSAECDAALTYARDRHRELDRAVRDIDTRLRILTYEGSLS